MDIDKNDWLVPYTKNYDGHETKEEAHIYLKSLSDDDFRAKIKKMMTSVLTNADETLQEVWDDGDAVWYHTQQMSKTLHRLAMYIW